MAHKHDHKSIGNVEGYLLEKGVRFTDLRRLVYDIIHKSRKPISAYDILAVMGKTLDNPKPPTVYRALDFLLEHGLVHKIESLNAFVGCHAGHNHSGSQFLVCDGCGDVEEVHLCDVPASLQKKIDQEKFELSRWNVEVHGTCADCRPSPKSRS